METILINSLNVPILKKSKIGVGDIEAYLDKDNQFVFKIISLYFGGFDGYIFTDLEEFFNFARKKCNIIYFHNLDFDFIFFIEKHFSFCENIEIVSSGGLLISVKFDGLEFRNSLMILPMSLKKVVRNFLGIIDLEWEKDKGSIFDLNYQDLCYYCLKDSYYTLKGVQEFTNYFKSEYSISNFLTIPSLSLKMFLKHYITEDLQKSVFNIKNRSTFFDNGYYFGGHTEKFVNNVYNFENIEYYDVNSLYPYIMKHIYIGIGKPIFTTPNLNTMWNLYSSDKIFYGEFLIDVACEEVRIFVSKDGESNKYKFGLNWFKISNLSIEFLVKNGFKNLIKDVRVLLYFQSKERIFKNYIDVNYDKRKIGDFEKIVYKLLLNSLYGKFGQKEEINSIFINYDKKDKKYSSWRVFGDNFLGVVSGFLNISSKKYLRKDISGTITESARLYMKDIQNKIEKMGYKVYYQDTDSFLTNIPNSKMFNLGSKLGELKRENNNVLSGQIIGSKIYYLSNQNEVFKASKGVKNMYENDYKNLSLYLSMKNINYSDSDSNSGGFSICKNHPNNRFFNTRFTKIKTYIQKSYFGISIVPHFMTTISERLD